MVVLSALAMSGAHALVSAGISTNCDFDGHCVTGSAASSNAGSNTRVEVQVVRDGTGAAVAICKGTANLSSLIEITCSHGNLSNTMSFPGTAGVVPLQTTQARLERLPVCWVVTGYFPAILGDPHIVSTDDCAQLAV
ncbi:MAG: hypothetical protein ABR613_08160 [Actinomycetota bacterium]